MQLNKILTYKNHIKTIFRPFIDLKIKHLKKRTNPIEGLVVSLTSYQERIGEIKYTLYSLFNQSVTPEKIILCISPKTILPKDIELFLNNGLIIEYHQDIGPYTKLIPIIEKYPNKIIVTADDDIYYPENWLEKLYSEYLKNPDYIHCHRAHRIQIEDNNITPYESWEKHITNVAPSFLNFLTGVGGVLYPPNCFCSELLNKDAFLRLAPKADDVWFWAMAVLSDRRINVVNNNIQTLRITNIFTQLGNNNLYAQNKSGGNDQQITAVLNNYPAIKEKLLINKKKTLIFDASSLYVYGEKCGKRAGIYNVASNLLSCFLNDSEFEVSLFCDYKYFNYITTLAEALQCNLIDKRTYYEKFGSFVFWKVKNFPHKLKYSILYLLRILDVLKPFNKELNKALKKYDIYFSPFEGIPIEVLKTSIKKYQFIHDIIPLNENKKLPAYHWGFQVFANITNEIMYFTNSEFTKKDFIKKFALIKEDDVNVAYLGYQKQDFSNNNIHQKYGIPNDKKYVLSLSAIGKRKNLDFAIKNFEEFIKIYNINDLVFVLAGSCWASYKNMILNTVTTDKVIFTGYIDDEDIPNIFSEAEMFIYPSLYEGFGLPIIEAMTYGTPVIASNRTSLPEVAGEAALLINPEDGNEFINALHTLFKEDSEKRTLILKGYEQAQKFSWANCYNIIRNTLLMQ